MMPSHPSTEAEEQLHPVQLSHSQDWEWLDVFLAASARRKMIFRATVIAAVLFTILAFVLPVKYVATAKILPPTQGEGTAAALLGQLAGGNGAATSLLTGALNVKAPSDIYVAMLNSRTIEDRLIDQFDLKKVYGKSNYVDARKKLESEVDISSGKEGVISVEVEDKSPQRAKQMADAYLDQLFQLSENIASSSAAQRRAYYDKELQLEKTKLADAEVDLEKTQQKTGMIVPSDQSRAIIDAIARVRGQLEAKEVQVSAMKTFAAPQNPQLVIAEQEVASLKDQLDKLEKNEPIDAGNPLLPTGKVPEVALEYIRKYREVKYHEALFEALAKQFELAKLDEAKDYPALQVLDRPVVPDKRSKPYRLLIISLGTLAGFIGATWWAIFQAEERREKTPEQSRKLALLRSYWSRS